MILKLLAFAGETPKIRPRLLADNGAQRAFNTRLDDGALTPIRKPSLVHQFVDIDLKTVYRHQGEWLGWKNEVHAVPGPVASDRLYITGDGVPKMMAEGATYPLAVPYPASALTATVSGTATEDRPITRLYVYTWVTDFEEESEPCPISNEVSWKPGQTVTLSGFEDAPAGREITKQRIYRSQTSMTGAQLYLIAERAATTSNFVDNIGIEDFQEALPSLAYNPPPDGLRGLTSMPNGMMAAFEGKDLYFCEPYLPHAWPASYVLTTDYDIVGLGAFGTSLAVMTTGNLYLVTGSAPENMIMEKLELNLPCVSSRAIVDLGYSIVYPSHDGLVMVSNDGARVVSSSLFSRDEWLRMLPSTFVASQYDGRYFVPYSFIDENEAPQQGTMIIDLTGEQNFLIRTDLRPQAMYYETQTGSLYMLMRDKLYQWDAIHKPYQTQSWKSKLFSMPRPTNFGALLIEADTGMSEEELKAIQEEIEEVLAENALLFEEPSLHGELNGDVLNAFPFNGDILLPVPEAGRAVAVNIYADQQLVFTANKLNKLCRLPSGFLAHLWEIEVVSNAVIDQLTLATTATELMQVN